MTLSDPDPDYSPAPGVVQEVAPGVNRILAPNPSPMTFRGTNTYLVGQRGLAVIDPGPDDTAHLGAILNALTPGQHVSHIIVTHAHLDHSPLSRRLSQETGAPVLAFGNALAGRSAAMTSLAQAQTIGGGEGVDIAFRPDITLDDGARIDGDGWSLEVLHTPGHFGNHICLALGPTLFSGDLVMGWASSLVSPPDGDLTDFMTSCRRLAARRWDRFLPGHGAPVTRPAARLDWLIAHRTAREKAILEALSETPGNAPDLAARIYTDTPPALLGAAARNVLAHLIDLKGRGLVTPEGTLHSDTVFRLTGPARPQAENL